MKVLFVNHTSHVSGAERSLLDLIASIQPYAHVILACPEGELMGRAQAIGVLTTRVEVPPLGFSSNLRGLISAIVEVASRGYDSRRKFNQRLEASAV